MYTNFFLPQQRKIPTIMTIVIVMAVIVFMGKMFNSSAPHSNASKNSLNQLTVTNITNNKASIYWRSASKSVDWVIWSEDANNLHSIALDERDIMNKKNSYLNHLVTLNNLLENKIYFFKIVSGDKLIGDYNDKPFYFKTSSTIISSSNIKPAYGKLINKNGQPLENAAVIFTLDGARPLMSLTKSGGDWFIPLNGVQDAKTGNIKLFDKGQKIKIEIYSEEGEKSTIISDLSSLSPIPQTLIIGHDYTFADQGNVLSASTSQGAEIVPKNDILFPKEGAVIPGINPIIKGVLSPNSEALVIVESPTTYSFRVKSDKDGIWRVNLTGRLDPGSHKVTLITKNEKGQETKTYRNFVIAKSGEQVLGAATPSGAATTIPSYSAVVPTLFLSPTISNMIASISSTLIKSGGSSSLYPILSIGLIVVGTGIILAF